MNNIYVKGNEVLIFKYIREWGANQDEINYIKGTIIKSKELDNLSTHGSVWTKRIYTVLGEDNNEYVGTYGSGLIGRYFFMTVEDYKRRLNSKIKFNEEKQEQLEQENRLYRKIISEFDNEQTKPKVKSI